MWCLQLFLFAKKHNMMPNKDNELTSFYAPALVFIKYNKG